MKKPSYIWGEPLTNMIAFYVEMRHIESYSDLTDDNKLVLKLISNRYDNVEKMYNEYVDAFYYRENRCPDHIHPDSGLPYYGEI